MWFARFGDKMVAEEVMLIAGVVELYFCFSMFANFVTDYQTEGKVEPEKNLLKISLRYLKGDFFMHLIPLLPFTFLVNINEHLRLLFLLKVFRIINGMKVLDVQTIFSSL